MNKYFITGGSGFIGSYICEEIFNQDKNSLIFILDKLTYAADKKYLSKIISSSRVKFIKGDILNPNKYRYFLKKCNIAINVAAESHVDRSFNIPLDFTKNNTLGAHIFLDECFKLKINKVMHISSDEVYGDIKSGKSKETDLLNPSNPYSASKAAAELIINSYKKSLKKKIIIVRGNNVYGSRQYPEKLIPKTIFNLIRGKKVPVHGNGENIRHFISAYDFAKAVYSLICKVNSGTYNVGSEESYSNLEIIKKICIILKKNFSKNIKFVKDRPYNDKRYAINFNKIKKEIGWKPIDKVDLLLPEIVLWYKKNFKKFL